MTLASVLEWEIPVQLLAPREMKKVNKQCLLDPQ